MSLSLGVPGHEVGVKVSLLCMFWNGAWNVERAGCAGVGLVFSGGERE